MKAWFKSKTIWVNLGVAVLGWFANAAQTMPIDAQWQLMIVGAVNLVLRAVTTEPIGAGDA